MGRTGAKQNLLSIHFRQNCEEALYLNRTKNCLQLELILKFYLTLFIKGKIQKCVEES